MRGPAGQAALPWRSQAPGAARVMRARLQRGHRGQESCPGSLPFSHAGLSCEASGGACFIRQQAGPLVTLKMTYNVGRMLSRVPKMHAGMYSGSEGYVQLMAGRC